MTPIAAGGLASSIAMLIMFALWIGIIAAVVIVVVAVRRWSFAAQQQAEAFVRIASAMERGVDPRAAEGSRSNVG